MNDLLNNKLRENEFPFIDSARSRGLVNKVIIFVIGGVTFSESRFIHNVNNSERNELVVLGGSSLLNSKDFYFKYL